MANRTDFDLNAACADWHRRMASTAAFRAEDAEELEGHLRDSVAALAARGLSIEEAFWVAQHRLGPSRPLVAEYAKVHPGTVWVQRLLWIVAGTVALRLVSAVAQGIGILIVAGCFWMGWTPGWLGPVAAGARLAALVAGLVVLWRLVSSGRWNGDALCCWAKARPLLAGVLLAGLLAAVGASGTLVQLVLVRTGSMSALGPTFVWQSGAAGVGGLLLWPILLLWGLRRQRAVRSVS
jgi:hypothetical protein